MRIVMLGDIVGRAGRQAVVECLPELRERYRADVIVVNGENAAGGFGITEAITEELLLAGADAVTLGNHAFDQREALVFIERQERLVRPINFPPGTPGRGSALVRTASGADVLVVNAMGRVFMGEYDDPFRAVDAALDACPLAKAADAVIVDFHAEATSEKQSFGYFLDGRASLVVGTHTHAPTADHRVLPQGTAFVSDIGMCGDYNSVLGMEAEEPINRFLRKIPGGRFQPSTGPATISGVAVETDDRTGLARAIWPIRIGGVLAQAEPDAWLA
ncbi:MAG: TIGR00282 family metallophosphoesterase [Hyphomicrobiaceae bacterium]